MIKIDNIVIPSNNKSVLLINNGCNVSIISNNSFLISTYTGTFFKVDGALINTKTNNLQLVNYSYTAEIMPSNKFTILKINQY